MTLFYIDLFCGAGGVTTGVIRAGGKVIACINHDPLAIQSHKANHRNVLHFTEDIRTFNLTMLLAAVALIKAKHPAAVICLWASLECTHFSKAKGGESRDADSRTLAWDLYRYIEAIKPDYIDIENVVEFMSWGPLRMKGEKFYPDRCELKIVKSKKTIEKQGHPYHMMPKSRKNGQDYMHWHQHICSEYGYDYDYRILNAADFGARTSRVRYFGQFKKPHLPFTWPEATHAKNPVKGGMFKGLRKWKPVRPCLDLDKEGTSIFSDKSKVKSEKTYERLYAGLIKHVGDGKEPAFITKWMSGDKTNKSMDDPCVTITTMNHLGIVQPEFMIKYNSTNQKTGKSNPVDLGEPSPTIAAQDRLGLAQPEFLTKYFSGNNADKNIPTDGPAGSITTIDHHALVQPKFFIVQRNGGDPKAKNSSIDDPARTITQTGGNLDLVKADNAVFLSRYNGVGNNLSVEDPAGAITTKDRLAIVWIDKQFSGKANHQSTDMPAGSILTNDKNCLVKAVWLDKHYSGSENHQGVDRPAGAILTKDKYALIQADHFLMNQYSGGGQHSSVDGPAPAVTTVPKSNLVSLKHYYLVDAQYNNKGRGIDQPFWTLIARMDKKPPYMVVAETGEAVIAIYEDDSDIIKKIKLFMAAYGIVDIKLRMLFVRELLRIQGFGEKYTLKGTQGDQKKFIGNSVPPLVVKRKVEARKKKLEEWLAGKERMVA